MNHFHKQIRAYGKGFLLLLLICSSALSIAQTASPFHVAILGDSNTWLGGDECNKPKGWNYWFCKRIKPTSCHSYARSGATWTNTLSTIRNVNEYTEKLGDDNVIYNQICRLQEAVEEMIQPVPHLIIIAAGTNDAWFTDKRPNVFAMTGDEPLLPDSCIIKQQPNEVLTLAESVRYGCTMLQNSFPNAQLVLLTPMQSTAVSTDNIKQAGNIIEACGHQMNIGVIRMDQEGCVVNRQQELRHHRYTYDGTHTSEEGARLNGYYIAEKIESIKR